MTTEIITDALKQIEKDHDVHILFAVESGSRAWGMHSKNSDYDVRFVYVRPTDGYLLLHGAGRDVIERTYEEHDLDMVGFDIYKFLRLLESSNPSCIEWLNSPIKYIDNYPDTFRERMADLMDKERNPVALYYHYKSMAKGNFHKYIHGKVKGSRKKYLYTTRGLMCALYVEQKLEVPPVRFETVINMVSVSEGIKTALRKLIKAKKAGKELDECGRITVLDDFIKSELRRNPDIENYKTNSIIFEFILQDALQ